MKKASRKPKKVASKPTADDFELSLVATIAALLMNGNHELNWNTAVFNALGLLDECRKELDNRRKPSTPAFVPYEEAVRRITGLEDTRFPRIEDAFRKFVADHPSGLVHMATGDLEFDSKLQRLRPQVTEADIGRSLEERKDSWFSEKEIDSLQSAYSEWKTTSKSGRRKKH